MYILARLVLSVISAGAIWILFDILLGNPGVSWTTAILSFICVMAWFSRNDSSEINPEPYAREYPEAGEVPKHIRAR